MHSITVGMGFYEDNWRSSYQQTTQLHRTLETEHRNSLEPTLFVPRCHVTPQWYHRRVQYPGKLPGGDLFHLVDPAYADSIPYIAKHYKKTLVTVTDIAFWHGRNWKNYLFRKKILTGLKEASAITAVSQQTANELGNLLNIHPIPVIYMGTEPDIFQHYTGPRVATDLLHVGSTDHRKGIDRILRLLTHLPEDIKLIQIGGRFSSDQLDFIDRLGLHQRITQKPNISLRELVQQYQSAAMVLMPSRYEGYGLPCIEARLTGTPLAASAHYIPALERLEHDRGTLAVDFSCFDSDEPSDYQSAVAAKLTAHMANVHPLANRQDYSWQHCTERFAALYHEILSQGRASLRGAA